MIDVTIVGKGAFLDGRGQDVGLPAVEKVAMEAITSGITCSKSALLIFQD